MDGEWEKGERERGGNQRCSKEADEDNDIGVEQQRTKGRGGAREGKKDGERTRSTPPAKA